MIVNTLQPEWPRPRVRDVREPVMLLLITPPNSGSTAIADFVAQLPEISGLTNS
ncbi:MAG: hypothetical protein Kow0013_21770 [Pararhodobacter sp.]